MKKLQRIFYFLFLFTLSIALLGCASSKKETDPKKVLQNAQQKNSELSSNDLTMKLDMNIDVSGKSLTMGMEMNCKSINDEASPQLALTGSIDSMGMSIPMEMYYKDNYLYLNILNQKMKQAMPLDDIKNQMIPSTQTFSLPEDAYKEISMTEDGSSQVITFTADGSKMTESVNSLLSTLQSQLGDNVSYTLNDVTGTITVNEEGYFTEEILHIPMTADIPESGEVTMDLTCTITIHDPGKNDLSIDFPDFSDFVESDLSNIV